MTRRTLAALFITTGATALLAEQAYEKLLEALVGTTTHRGPRRGSNDGGTAADGGPHVPHQFVVWGSGIASFAGAEALRAFVTAVVIVPPAAVIGAVFPLLFRLREFPTAESGWMAGAMTAANAIGCCAPTHRRVRPDSALRFRRESSSH